eukprot:Clim_evm1s164 gene=Clim_evmTU1s164
MKTSMIIATFAGVAQQTFAAVEDIVIMGSGHTDEDTSALTGGTEASVGTSSTANVALIAGVSVGAAVLVGAGVAGYFYKKNRAAPVEEALDA